MRLTNITFTGIDAKTDLVALHDIQQQYPFVEFGVLTSYHWYENGNRYLDPYLINRLQYSGLNLSLHICGGAAYDAAHGYWTNIDKLTWNNLVLFKRVQLNIAERKDNPDVVAESPVLGQKVIIQQRNAKEVDLFKNTLSHHFQISEAFSVLLDASGGRGIDTSIDILDGNYEVGYAGGINPDNVAEKLSYLMKNANTPFWIDMESGVRTDDWFDVDKVRKVLEICSSVLISADCL